MLPVGRARDEEKVSSFIGGRHPFFGSPGRRRTDPEAGEKESFAAAAKLFSHLRANAGNRRRRIHLKARRVRFSFANVALQALSRIAERQGNWHGALEAWQHALDIDPRTPGGLDRLDKLQKKVDGEAT